MLSPTAVKAFSEELEKIAFLKGIKKDLAATGRDLTNPSRLAKRLKSSLVGPNVPLHVRALTGLGLAGTIAESAPEKDPSGQGRSRLRRALEGAGTTLGGLAGKGLVGSIAGGIAGSTAGGLAGRAIDTVRGYKSPE